MKTYSYFIARIVFFILLLHVFTASQLHAQGQRPAHHPSEMNKKFTAPELDIQEFVKRFENESRDIYAQRKAIVDAVNLQTGDAVADLGAGTGLFTFMFAERVGSKGKVYAVDIGPAFLKHIAKQAHHLGQKEVVKTVRGTQDSTNLLPGSVDVVFICDTYHHFEHPRKMLDSIHGGLRPGGRLVLVDFDLREDSSEFIKQRARAPKEVYFREIVDAGFVRIETKDALKLKENFYAEFRWVERTPGIPVAPGKGHGARTRNAGDLEILKKG